MKMNLVTPFYLNDGMLKHHLQNWASWPSELLEHFRFVIVDDCSPEPARIGSHPGEIWLFRVEVNVPWAWDHARNVAMHEIPDEWALITDIDHVLSPDNAERLVSTPLKRKNFYTPGRRRKVDGQPYKPHPNSFVLTRDMYWKAGGYNEDFTGYYGKDSVFNRQLDAVGKRCAWPELELLLFGREVIADASTNPAVLGRKGTEYDVALNPELRRLKARAHPPFPVRPLRLPYTRIQ